jgi:hypothetical protein
LNKVINPIAEEGEQSSQSQSFKPAQNDEVKERNVEVSIESERKCLQQIQSMNLANVLRGLYMKKPYRLATNIFGTLVVFFMVALRIELILLDSCAIEGKIIFRGEPCYNCAVEFVLHRTCFSFQTIKTRGTSWAVRQRFGV